MRELRTRWSLTLGEPFQTGICSWVAPAVAADGAAVVLKLGLPHMEGAQEIAGLRFWNGDPTARLIDADDALNAMLLERCVPGTLLRTRPEPEQDVVIAKLLNRMWRRPASPHPFRPLSAMARHWIDSSLADADRWLDPATHARRLAGDGRNGTRATGRRAARHRPACRQRAGGGTRTRGSRSIRSRSSAIRRTTRRSICSIAKTVSTADPMALIARFADLLGVDRERVRLWAFARLAAEPRDWSLEWNKSLAAARLLAP